MTCTDCKGCGRVLKIVSETDLTPFPAWEVCPTCNGTGTIPDDEKKDDTPEEETIVKIF